MSDNLIVILELVLLVGLVVWVALRKKKSCSQKFDEMQLKLRAKGYRISFFTALLAMAATVILMECNMLGIITPALAVMAALMISVTVFAVYCILNDAFISFSGTPKNHLFLYSLIVLVEIANVVRLLIRGEVLVSGMVDFTAGAAVLMAVAFLVILITLIIKTNCERKEAEE